MKLTIDFETRSPVDLRKCGAWVYAENQDTDVMCLAVKIDDEKPMLWLWDNFISRLEADGINPHRELPLITLDGVWDLICKADEIEAHNAAFERAIWQHVMTKKHGMKMLPLKKLRCSLAKASVHSLPRALDAACSALGVAKGKDLDGYKVMMKMCKPRKPRKDEYVKAQERGLDADSILYWHEEPEDIIKLARYCMQDVEAEHSFSSLLEDLSPKELQVWRMDQEINARGIQADVSAAVSIIGAVKQHEARLLSEFKGLTGGAVKSPKQVAAFVAHLGGLGVKVPNLRKQTVVEVFKALDSEEFAPEEETLIQVEEAAKGNPTARRLLEIRRSLSKSSVAKYNAIVRRANTDGRIRGAFLYHGAGTGRWAGQGVQLQNLPRESFKDVEDCLATFCGPGLDVVDLIWGDPMRAASYCVRPTFRAAPGHDLIAADFSAIEARVLCWLAGSERLMDVFRQGKDNYKVAASGIYKTTYGEVTPAQRQIGKVAELACGYQGHVGAFQSMARVYGVKVPDDQAAEIVNAWREERPEVVALWYALEDAAKAAIENPGRITGYKRIAFRCDRDWLMMKLPSGRLLYYYRPEIVEKTTAYGRTKPTIKFMGVDSMTKKFGPQYTYGGKITENADQAMSRDLMAEAMFRVEARGYPIVMHVHDELIAEVLKSYGSVEEFETVMSVVPPWAEGCPIRAEGWRGERYRK